MKIQRYLDSSPVFRVMSASETIRKKLNRRLGESELGFLPALILVSLFFEEDRAAQPALLHRTFGTTKGNISHCLAHLEERRMIKRVAHPRDRRISRVVLTPSGATLCAKLIGYFDAIQSEFEIAFSPGDARQFLDGLAKLSRLGAL